MKIQRKILFYNVISPTSIVDLFQKLSALKPEDMYMPYFTDDKQLFVTITDIGTNVRGKLNYFRATDFPTAIKKNAAAGFPLPLKDDEGLCNSTHFIYYPEKKIIAIEYNNNGPRMNALKDYLDEKTDPDFEYEFPPILRTDVLEELSRVKEIKLFDIKVSSNSLEQAKYIDNNIYEALENAKRVGGSETVTVKLSSGRKKGTFLDITPSTIIKGLTAMTYDKIIPATAFDTLKIKGVNAMEEVEEIDLLKQWTVGQVAVAQMGKGREVDSDSMFTQIQLTFERLSPTIGSI